MPERVLEVASDVEDAARWARDVVHHPFDLERGPLYRFRLLRTGPERHVLLLAFHHLLVDGLALEVLLRELGVAYAAFRQGQPPTLPAPRPLEHRPTWPPWDARRGPVR
ncbi:condensation domain-containing protein, partial [Pyxidicoccus sp. 3LG]